MSAEISGFDGESKRFQRIEISKLKETFQRKDWYLDPSLLPVLKEYFEDDDSARDEKWKQERRDFVTLTADLLDEGAIALGTSKGEGYNDDDKAIFKDGKPEWVQKPTTVVIHHTALDAPYRILNAWHLMSLYAIPLYSTKMPYFYGTDTEPLAPESGHFFEGEGMPRHQTFIGYTVLVREDGSSVQTLKDEYMGFHAGDLTTNRNSIGISIVDDLTNKRPSNEAIDSIAKEINMRIESGTLPKDFKLIGHQEVTKPDKSKVQTICPGNLWTEWKKDLEQKIAR